MASKYIIYAGKYGSGKTEIALNTALFANRQGKRCMLLDMDIVNPYFRSSDQEQMLLEKGIQVVKPCFASTTVDVPSLPPQIYQPFDEKDLDLAIFDAGGEPIGAAALGILQDRFLMHWKNCEFLYVINPLRPMQETPEKILFGMAEIEEKCHLPVTGLVDNTNLALQTTQQMREEGAKIVAAVAKAKGVPIRFATSVNGIKPKGATRVFPLSIYMRPAWLDASFHND